LPELLVALAKYVNFKRAFTAWKQQLILYQPLSLLLKACPLITELALYDVVNTPGVATDLSHISTPAVCGTVPEYNTDKR
jgi:hypothetical protein